MAAAALDLAHRAYIGYQAIQCASIYGETHHPHMTKDVHRITFLFMGINTLLLLWTAYSPLQKLTLKQKVIAFSASTLSGGAYYLYSRKKGTPEKTETFTIPIQDDQNSFELEATVSTYHHPPQSQRIARALYVAQIIQIIGHLYLGGYKRTSLLQLIGAISTFVAAYQMRWVEIQHKSPIPLTIENETFNPTISYHALLPYHRPQEGQECPILFEAPDSYYCSNKHLVCAKCLTDFYVQKVKDLAKVLLDGQRIEANFHHKGGVTLTFYCKEEEIPSCPVCREVASHAFLSFKQGRVHIHKEQNGPQNVPQSSFWPGVYLLFSAVQLSMALVQYTHPHLAAPLYKTQKALLLLDLFAVAGLFLTEDDQSKVSSEEKTEKLKWGLTLSFIVGSSIALYHWKKEPSSFNDALKGKVSKAQLKHLSVTDLPPISHRVMQVMYSSRFFIILATAALSSDNKKLLFTAALLNGLTLLKLSQVNWLCFERTYSIDQAGSTITPRFHFMIPNPSKMFPDEETWTKTLSQIYDYTTTFFHGSTKKIYWEITRQNGFVSSRRLYFDYRVLRKPLEILGRDFASLLLSWGGKGYHKREGLGTLNLSYSS